MNTKIWSVVVVECPSEKAQNFLVDFFSFCEGIGGVKDIHFLIRDRVGDKVVFSFRVFLEQKDKDVVTSKILFKLKSMALENCYSINPDSANPMHKYAAFPWKETSKERGAKKFSEFCKLLSKMSQVVVSMAKMDYFNSKERVELAHVMSWILGCTEYGLLSTKGMQIGYYDRIEDRSHVYLKQDFSKCK